MMNKLVSLNNQAVDCLVEGNAFDACNILMEMSSLYMKHVQQQEGEHKQEPSSAQPAKKHGIYSVQWVSFPTATEETTKTTATSTTHSSTAALGHPPGDNTYCQDVLLPAMPYNFALLMNKECCVSPSSSSSRQNRNNKRSRNGRRLQNGCGYCHSNNDDDTDDGDEYCPCTITPTMWYNSAIACQTLAFQQDGSALHSDERKFYLERSLFLYQKVLDLIGAASTSSSRSPSSSRQFFAAALRCAIWNNMTLIYRTLGQHEQSLQGILNLQRQLRFASPSFLYHDGARVFYVNITLFQQPTCLQGPCVAGAA